MARKRNPITDPPKGRVRPPKKRKKKKPLLTKKEREAAIAEYNYRDRVKRMRGIFGDQFKAKDGYDLRKFNSWTPAQKSKVTKYFRVIAPRITGPFVKKYYRRKDHLTEAIVESQQEQLLPGQTAAVFSVDDPREKVQVKFSKKKPATVVRRGIEQVSLRFDRAAFLDDPEAEVERVLDLTDANVFRIITGANLQNRTLNRNEIIDEIFKIIANYSADTPGYQGRSFDEWLNGLVAYPGTQSKVRPKIQQIISKHAKITSARRQQHNRERAKRGGRNYTAAELKKGRGRGRRK